jgi:hypothetical protein
MPLPKQTAQIPFVGGVDTKTDPKQVEPIKLLALENAHFDTLKQLSKRNGFNDSFTQVEFQNNDTIAEAGSAFTKDDQLLLNARQTLAASGRTAPDDGWRFYTWLQAQDEWRDVGVLQPLELSIFQVGKPTDSGLMYSQDVAETNGFYCFIHIVSSQVVYSVMDSATGALIYDTVTVGPGAITEAHVVAVGDSFHIYAIAPTGADLLQLIIDTTSLETVAANMTDLGYNDVHADGLFDVTIANDIGGAGETAVVGYKDTTPEVTLRWFNEAGAFQFGSSTAEVAINVLSVQRLYDVTNNIYTIAATYQVAGGNIRYFQRNEDATVYTLPALLTAATAGTTAIRITCTEDPSLDAAAPGGTSTIRWYIEIVQNLFAPTFPAGTPWYFVIYQVEDHFAGGAATDLDIIFNSNLASKAFEYEGKAHVWLAYETDLQSSLFLTQAKTGTTARYDARALYMVGDGMNSHALPQVVQTGAPSALTSAIRRDRLEADGDILLSQLGVQVNFGGNALDRGELGPTKSVAAGGFIGDFDNKFQELNFHIFPEMIRAVPNLASGNLPDDTYNYKVHYEWYDRQGQIHRSAVSPIFSGTMAGGPGRMQFDIPCIHKGEVDKLVDVQFAIFREWTDGLYHRVDSSGLLPNLLTAQYRTVFDEVLDISANEILYTEGGILEDFGPPASRIMTVRQNRAFIVPEEDRELVWYTKDKKHGFGIQFTPLLTRRISAGGEIIALQELDEKIIVFKRREIHAFTGRGPNDLGTGPQFTETFLITTDVGCTDRRSVVRMDKGIMFQSEKGIYLLTRGLELQYIGAAVEFYNSVPVVKAFEVDHKNQVRFLLRTGVMLVFDHLINQWSVTTSTDWGGLDFLQDAVVWDNAFYLLDENGVFKEESSAGFTDNGDYIPLDIETSWFKMAQLQGFQRIDWISFLGEWISEHTLTVDVYTDYVDTVRYTKTLTANAAFGAEAPYQFRFKPSRGYAKCEAIKFRIVDARSTGVGSEQSFSLSGVAFDYKTKKGLYKQARVKTL